jgi:hypothetical protein
MSVTEIGAVLLQLHSQRVGIRLHRVLGGGVDALKRHRAIRHFGTDVDDGAATFAQVGDRGTTTVHDPPEIDVKEATFVLERHFGEAPIDRYARVVHPGVKTAEFAAGSFRQRLHGVRIRDITCTVRRTAPASPDTVADLPQIVLTARVQHDARTPLRRQLRCREADPARCACDDDDLIVDVLEFQSHALASGLRGKCNVTAYSSSGTNL